MLDLDTLEAFVAACQDGSVSRAARHLFRSQPAVTRQIAALETQMGIALLDRTSKGVRPTAAGREVLDRAIRLLRDARSLREVALTPGESAGSLRIACSDTVARYWLAPHLGTFAARYPRISLELDLSASPEISHRVAHGLSDVGFVLLPLQHPSLSQRVVLRYRHVAAFASGKAPGTGTSITPEILAGSPLVLLGRQTRSRQLIEEGFRKKGLRPDRVVEVGNVSVQKELVRVGLGVGVLPDYASSPGDGLEYRPIEDASVREIALVTHKTDFVAGPADLFVKSLLEGRED
jgi:DNA-binding transcriptional LysR family regulator